jgi:hypothetical protein
MAHSHLVTNHPFNQEWNKGIIGIRFAVPPSYTAVKLVEEPADYHSWEEYNGEKFTGNPE